MKVTPQINADFEAYPELRTLYKVAIRHVATLMQLHNIVEIRRIQKHGVFDRPYTKDIVSAIGITGVPDTVDAVRNSTGKILLDYLETIGIRGLSLELTQDDVDAVEAIWNPPVPTDNTTTTAQPNEPNEPNEPNDPSDLNEPSDVKAEDPLDPEVVTEEN